jgi:glycerol-3-phosphate acyltransferase PlsY
MMNFFTIIIGLLAYLIGAIPVGYLIAQLKGISDIRAHGSGNIGATNVSRFLGIHYFFLIFFLDAGKAFLFLHTIKPYFPANYLYIFAALLLFGNGYSVFLRGSGGKGGATLCGLIAALNMYITGLFLCIWIILLTITPTVGIASIITAILFPIFIYTFYDTQFFLFSLFAALWIIKTHRSNIRTYWKTCFSNN